MSRVYGFPEPINELGGTTNVSTLTVLKAFTKLGTEYHTLLFVVENQSATDACTMIVETSENGTFPDANQVWNITVGTQKQGSLEVGPGQIRKYWRLSAQTAGPTVAVKWAISGVSRR